MYCPSCGTPNSDSNRFCLKCGTTLPTLTASRGTREPATVTSVTSWSGWRIVGWFGLIGSTASLLAFFFMTWLLAPVINPAGLYGQNASEISGLTLVAGTVRVISAYLEHGTSTLLRLGFGFLPSDYQSLLMAYFLDTILLIIVPIIGLVIAFNSYRLIRSTGRLREKTRLRLMQVWAIVGLLPVIAFFILAQLLLAFSSAYSNPLGGSPDTFSLGLKYMASGYWLTFAGLLLVVLAGPLAAPKQTR